jgi:hypothetical protein
MDWKPSEHLCEIFCTHIDEETDPYDSENEPDFGKRWLANISVSSDIHIERKIVEDFAIITKTKCAQKEVIVVMKGETIVLLYYFPLSVPTRLETLIDNEDSLRAAKMLQIEPDEVYNWQEVEKI